MEVENEDVIVMSVTDKPPVHFLLKVKSFSLFSEVLSKNTKKRYESTAFKAGGYKWKLILYPNGHEARNGEGHVSLYLMITETETLPRGWTVNAIFQFFVYDHIRDKYFTFKDSKANVKCFNAMKKGSGFPRLLSHEDFKNPFKGFLAGDSCYFGVEVFVQNHTENLECLSTSEVEDKVFSWKIENFSKQEKRMIESDIFVAGGLNWVVQLYPRGYHTDGHLSLFLKLMDTTEILAFAQFLLLIKDQRNSSDLFFTSTAKSYGLKHGWGWYDFISLSDLNDPTKGYLVDDTLILEAKVEAISKFQRLS